MFYANFFYGYTLITRVALLNIHVSALSWYLMFEAIAKIIRGIF